MTKTSIEWCNIPGEPGYKANILGEIIGPSKKILRPIVSKSGHMYVFVHQRKKFVHRLILETFVGYCPEGMECRHLDGDPSNNHLSNLQWGTRLENVADRRRHGRMPIPYESIFTKLKPEHIPVIRDLHKKGLSTRDIGSRFRTSHTTIQKILRCERWKGY